MSELQHTPAAIVCGSDTPIGAALLARLELSGKKIAVERNGEIVPKSAHAQTLVADGDQLEIVVAVGGG